MRASASRVKAGIARTLALIGALVALGAVYQASVRTWFKDWGASAAERSGRLPGDEIVPSAEKQETRAITIQAPAARVWAYVAQLGQDRAGFYSYEILENLVGCEMPSIEYLDSSLSQWKRGDKLWMYPPHKAGGVGFATLQVFVPGQAMGFATRQIGTPLTRPPDGSWSFAVKPLEGATSRLIIRGRAAGGLAVVPAAFDTVGFEPAHFVMERRMMESIKMLAEGQRPSAARELTEVILWILTFIAFVVAGVRVLVERETASEVTLLLAAGVLFQFLTLAQPSLLISVPLVAAVLVALGLRFHRVHRRRVAAGASPLPGAGRGVHAPARP